MTTLYHIILQSDCSTRTLTALVHTCAATYSLCPYSTVQLSKAYLFFHSYTALLMLNQLTKKMNRDKGFRVNEPGGKGVGLSTIDIYMDIHHADAYMHVEHLNDNIVVFNDDDPLPYKNLL